MGRITTIISVINIFYYGIHAINGERSKRVIHGSPVLDIKNSDYLAFRYFVWIANGHNCDSPVPEVVKSVFGKDKNWEFGLLGPYLLDAGYVCAPKPQHLQCSGSLLAPFVVQTACHCLVDFIARDKQYQYSKVYNVAEKMFTVHPLRMRVEDIGSDGVFSKSFIVHPKCAKQEGAMVHDYALILLGSSFASFQHAYAPLYSITQLAKNWLNTMAREKVCLILGFGTFSWKENEDYEDNNALKSDVLRHGWVVALDYYQCYEKMGWVITNYTEEATDLCGVNLDGRPGQGVLTGGRGDSGGPVSCDNEYVGLQSERHYVYAGDYAKHRTGYGRYMSTAFSVYENSIEFRAELSYKIYDLYNGTDEPINNHGVIQPPIKIFLGRTSISCPRTRISTTFVFYSAVISIILTLL